MIVWFIIKRCSCRMWAMLLVACSFASHSGESVFVESKKESPKIWTAREFLKYENTADSRIALSEYKVAIHSNLPPFKLELIPGVSRSEADKDFGLMGKIKVYRQSASKPFQVIEVRGADQSFFVASFRMADVNFDGYLDIGVMREAGAKWRSDNFWLFDPISKRFVTSKLTSQLGELMYHGLEMDAKKKELRVALWIGLCTHSFEVYRVEAGKLKLIESEMHEPLDGYNCKVTRRKWINGKWVVSPPIHVWHGKQ